MSTFTSNIKIPINCAYELIFSWWNSLKLIPLFTKITIYVLFPDTSLRPLHIKVIWGHPIAPSYPYNSTHNWIFYEFSKTLSCLIFQLISGVSKKERGGRESRGERLTWDSSFILNISMLNCSSLSISYLYGFFFFAKYRSVLEIRIYRERLPCSKTNHRWDYL